MIYFFTNLKKYLKEDELKLVYKNYIRNDYKAGELIIKQGNPNVHVLILIEGAIKLYKKKMNDEECIIEIIKSPNIIGESCILNGEIYNYSAIAIEKTRIGFIKKEVFFKIIEKNGILARKFLELMSLKNLKREKIFFNLLHKQLPGRISCLLLDLSELYKSESFDIQISRNELAQLVGASEKSFIRSFNEFNNDGLIKIKGKKIEIVRKDLLKRISIIG